MFSDHKKSVDEIKNDELYPFELYTEKLNYVAERLASVVMKKVGSKVVLGGIEDYNEGLLRGM